MIRAIICIAVLFLGFPYLLGMLIAKLIKVRTDKMITIMLLGYMMQCSLFQVIVIPCVVLKLPMIVVIIVWLLTMIGLSVPAICMQRGRWKYIVKNQWQEFHSNVSPVCILFLAAFAVQLILVVGFAHYDLDDAYYLGIASDAYQTGKMYQYSPYTGGENDLLSQVRYFMSGYEMYVAAIGTLMGVHPTIIFHSILPVVHLLLIYMAYLQIADVLFENQKKQKWIFMMFVAISYLFGYVSIYTSSTFVMVRLWQGKAMLAGFIIPLMIGMAMHFMKKEQLRRQWLPMLLTQITACFFTSMGALIAPILFAALAIVNGIRYHSIRMLFYSAICVLPCILTDLAYVLLR
mgnify:FL=1